METTVGIRSLAVTLRKRFEGHTLTVRTLVAQLSDVELVEEFHASERIKLEALRTKQAAKAKKTLSPLKALYAKALVS